MLTKDLIESCKMTGAEVATCVSKYGEDLFIHLDDALPVFDNHDKMTELLSLHRSVFVHMLENVAPTATIEDVEKVKDLVAKINEVLGDE